MYFSLRVRHSMCAFTYLSALRFETVVKYEKLCPVEAVARLKNISVTTFGFHVDKMNFSVAPVCVCMCACFLFFSHLCHCLMLNWIYVVSGPYVTSCHCEAPDWLQWAWHWWWKQSRRRRSDSSVRMFASPAGLDSPLKKQRETNKKIRRNKTRFGDDDLKWNGKCVKVSKMFEKINITGGFVKKGFVNK